MAKAGSCLSGEKVIPIRITRRNYGGIPIGVTPQVDRFVPCVICLKHPAFEDLTFETNIELVALRNFQIGFDRPKWIARARDVSDRETCIRGACQGSAAGVVEITGVLH